MKLKSTHKRKSKQNYVEAQIMIEKVFNLQKNVIDVPIVCPVGQKPDKNGKCQDEWLMRTQLDRVSCIP